MGDEDPKTADGVPLRECKTLRCPDCGADLVRADVVHCVVCKVVFYAEDLTVCLAGERFETLPDIGIEPGTYYNLHGDFITVSTEKAQWYADPVGPRLTLLREMGTDRIVGAKVYRVSEAIAARGTEP